MWTTGKPRDSTALVPSTLVAWNFSAWCKLACGACRVAVMATHLEPTSATKMRRRRGRSELWAPRCHPNIINIQQFERQQSRPR